MKIMLLMESWGTGGTEVYVKELLRFLHDSNYQTHLILLKSGKENEEPFLKKITYSICSTLKLPAILRRERPDICHLHLYTSLLPAVGIIRVTSRIPCIATLHMPLSVWSWRHRQYWLLALQLCQARVGVSNQVVTELRGRNMYPSPIPGAISSTFYGQRKTSGNVFRIFAVGRLSNEKNWPTLVRAIADLRQGSNQDCILEHFGDGPLRASLEQLAHRLHVDVIWHGHVAHEDLAAFLVRADLFVLPSRFEGMGLAAVEAMSMGVPTITADFPAAQDFITHGVTGHTFPGGDHEVLGRLIAWHINNPDDSVCIGNQGQVFVQKKFSVENTFAKYLPIYKDCVTLVGS